MSISRHLALLGGREQVGAQGYCLPLPRVRQRGVILPLRNRPSGDSEEARHIGITATNGITDLSFCDLHAPECSGLNDLVSSPLNALIVKLTK